MSKEVTVRIECHTIFKYKKADIAYVSFGGYDFVINDKNLCFDFDANSAKILEADDNLKIVFETGRGLLFNDYDVSDDYEEEYAEYGIAKEDITAEFLASVSSISEIAHEIVDKDENDVMIWIDSIVFTDENDNTYKVDPDVVARYNLTEIRQ